MQGVDAALQSASEAVRGAKSPQDLDAVIEQLTARQNLRGDDTSALAFSNAVRRLNEALSFVRRWQEYLAAEAAGDLTLTAQILHGLIEKDESGLVPRSEILARWHQAVDELSGESVKPTPTPEPVDLRVAELLGRIKSLADLRAGLDALDKIGHDEGDRLYVQAATVVSALAGIDRNYRDFLAGDATDIAWQDLRTPVVVPIPNRNRQNYYRDVGVAMTHDIQETAIILHRELFRLSLPRALGLPIEQRVRPGETAFAHLERIKTEAAGRSDYPLVARAESTRVYLRTGTGNDLENSQATLFAKAARQDAAGQYVLAVTAYEKALAAPGDLIPPKVIGQRLQAIQAGHPQEFQQGLSMYLSPPAPANRYFGPPPWNSPPGQPPPPPPALQVPAAPPPPSK